MSNGMRVFCFIALTGILIIFSNKVFAYSNDTVIKSFFEQVLEKMEAVISIQSEKKVYSSSISSFALIANCEPPENPSFENGVVDWSFGANASITTDAAVGTNAARIGTAAGTIYSTISDINTNSDYSLSFQAKANTLSTDATISLRWLDASGSDVGINTVNIPNTASYTEFTVASTSPSNATELLIYIEKQANGTLFLDEFCLTEIEQTSTYTSTDVPITIISSQATTITSTIVINEPGLTIEDLNLDLNISHTYVGDLDVTLISPAGTSVLLYNNHCGSNNDIIFKVDDEASLISCPPNDGNNHSVLTSLSEFDGEELSGTWTLQVYDYYAQDGGSLNSWSLEAITNSLNLCNNGIDDDGDGLVDEYDPNCDCGEGSTYSIGSGAAASVVSQVGVNNWNEADGNPDGNAAELYETTDEIILDLGFILKIGQAYSIIWHKKTSYGAGAPADMLVAESLNPSTGFVDNPINPSTAELNTFVKSSLSANVDTRYIKIKTSSGGGNDLVLDAIIFDNIVQCTQSEICDNAIDDDGDGDIDEADSDCDCNSCYQPVVQEYHIPFPEDQVFASLSTIFPGNSSNSSCNSGVPSPDEPINSYVSVSVFIDNSIIYFDHWEDDFETQVSNPTQATSQIWGDGNPFNGAPPGISSDILYAGTVIILDNAIDPATRQSVFDYDGGDRFATSFPISITRSAWASGSETLFAGALEVYPTSDWGTEYRFPAGQNVDASLQYFEYVGAVVMAQVDGTVINIDKDNNGSFEQTITLAKGQSQLIDGGILIGGRVNSSEPVQVNMITGDICDSYESRWLTIPPITNWSNDYISPVYGSTQKYYIYNPSTSAMTIEVETTTNGNFATLNVPAGGTANFVATESSGYRVSNNGGANFYAYVLHDATNGSSSENSTWDWGAALLPLNKLSQQIITGWAPGQDPTKPETENGSPVWVTAAYPASSSSTGPVTICIDYDGNGQGAFTDSFGRQYDVTETLDVLEAYQAFDPDGDQTSMLIYICNSTSDAVLSAIWGQDAATASVGAPGLDVGTGIPGLNPYFAYKTVTLIGDIDNNDEYNVGDTIQYAIGLANLGFVPISGNFSVSDVLPTELIYIPNSTKIVSIAGNASIADQGVSPYPLDEGGINTYLALNPSEEAQVQFNAVIASVPAGNLLINVATTTKDNITYTPEVIVEVDVVDEICDNGIDDDLDGLIDCDCLSEGNVITGNVWGDEDENTVNNDETGVGNIQINIYLDGDGDGDIDTGDNLINTATTDVNGNYAVEVSGGMATSRVSANNDDGEEHRGFFFQGAMNRNNDNLRLGNAGSQAFSPTLVGTRFRDLTIPQGATITNAYIEFTADASFGGAGNLTIIGEDIDDAPELGNGYNNISSRTATTAVGIWTDVPSWFSEQVYETPDISNIVQEIVDRGGWSSGNDMFFAFYGDARRSAYSYNGDHDKAPHLVVQYSIYPSHYIVEIDNSSILAYSAGASLTTPDKTEIEFNAKNEFSCDNNFGLRVVEICGNNVDDDFDGDTDCDDVDCGVDITVGNNGPVCAGAVIQLSGLAETDYVGTTSFLWTGPNSFTSTEQHPTLVNATALMAGTYTFTATNDNGCASTGNSVVVVQVDCSGICDQVIQVTPTNPTECFLDNGSILVTEYGANPSFYQNSIDGITWFESEYTYSNLTVGNYNIFLRDKVTGITCRTVSIDLIVQDETIYTGENVTPASSCFAADGSIQLIGVDGTDRVSWISSTNPTYVLISSLSPANTITGLTPGTYYVRVVRGNNNYCYSERIVEIPNNGTPCDDELCDGNTRINLFPNGDFGTGVFVNGSPLDIGVTSYGYTPMTCSSPNDGQYSIINTSDCDGNGNGIYNAFVVTDDHTPGDINGYMMLVNASFNPDIALERTVTTLCEDTEYEFSLWINNMQPQAPIKPNLTFLIDGVGQHTTGDITVTGWQKVGFTFFTGSTTSSVFSIRNNAPGGFGNDWAIDDVFVGLCQPEVVNVNTIDKCFDAKDETIDFVVNDDNKQFIYYQFEESRDNGVTWSVISTPQIGTFVNGTYTAVLSFPAPLTNAYDGRQYTILLGTTLANLTNGCEVEAESSTTLNIIACDEICTNTSDDDGDGLTPLYDPDCQECPIGSITYHRWNSLPSNSIEDLTIDADYPNNPDVAETRTSFETAVNSGDQYGVRMVGYLHPTVTGNYTFYVSSNDNSELYLSTDNLMSNKQLIASVSGETPVNNLTNYPSQTSVTISLQAGGRYFIEGLQSEGSGGDHLQVFWTTPSNATPTIIAGQYLSPYGCEICADGVDNDGNGLTDCDDITVCETPSVSVNSNLTLCAGETVNLSASASGGDGNYTYTWDNGLGTGNTKSFTATAPSTSNSVIDYNVIVTDGNGCTATDVVRVTVYSNPEVSAAASNEYCGQDNGTITFTFTDNTNRTGIAFSIDNGSTYPYSTSDNLGSFTTPGLSAGTYQLFSRWGNANCPVDLGSVILSDIPAPTVTASVNDNDICEGETVTLTAVGSGGTGTLIYTWSNGAGSGASVDVTPSTTTTYTVTVTDSQSCTNTDQVVVNVTNNFDDGGTIGADESNCDSFNPANITNVASPAAGANGTIQYRWQRRESNGSGGWSSWSTVSGATGLTYDPATISITTQYRRISRRLPCTQWQYSNIITKIINELPVANAGTDINICAGETINLSAVASGGDGNYTYTWDNGLGGGASHSFTATAANTANETTDYTVTATDGNGCTDSDVIRVQVYSLPSVTTASASANCGQANGNITLSFVDNSSRTGIEFSIDGGATYPHSTNDNVGSLIIDNLLAGSYDIQARWDNGNCPVSFGTEIINDLDGPSVVNGSDQRVCAGELVTLTAIGSGGTGGLNYTWDNGLGNGASHTFIPPASSNRNLTTTYIVTAVDAEGCRAVSNVNVTVESQPVIIVNKSDEHCSQADGYIIMYFNDNADQSQIEFSIDGGTTYPYTTQDVDGSFVIGNLSAGTYNLWARWGDGDCPVSIESVTLSNSADISVLVSPDRNACLGEGIGISAAAAGGTFPYFYSWDNGLGSGQSKTVYPTTTTTYNVTATDNFGCTAIDDIVVTVLPSTDPECSRCIDPADADNDGICASEDCDDNDPTLPMPVGTSCDDSNSFTINDVIQQDGCTCAGDYIPCSTAFNVLLQQPTYNDNGTASNLSDDTFTFDLTISGSGSGWTANGQTGTYGQTVTFGPYTVDAVGVTFDVVDQDNPNCSENISVNISSCIYSGVCTCCN